MSSATANEEPDGPAILRPQFRQDRVLSPRAGSKKGFRVLSPFEQAFERGQLRGPEKDPVEARKAESARWEAGNQYAEMYRKAQPGRQDILAGGGGSVSGAGGDTAAVNRIAHANKLAATDRLLSRKDRQILAYCLGEEMTPAQAIQAALGMDYERAVSPRFRESLDRLVEALGD